MKTLVTLILLVVLTVLFAHMLVQAAFPQAAPSPSSPSLATFSIPDSLSLQLQRALNRRLRASIAWEQLLDQVRKQSAQGQELEAATAALDAVATKVRAAAKIPVGCQLRVDGEWQCPPAAPAQPATKDSSAGAGNGEGAQSPQPH